MQFRSLSSYNKHLANAKFTKAESLSRQFERACEIAS